MAKLMFHGVDVAIFIGFESLSLLCCYKDHSRLISCVFLLDLCKKLLRF